MLRRYALAACVLSVAAGCGTAMADPGCSGVWRRLDTPTSPPALCSHAAIYDPVRDRVVVFGGSGSSSAAPSSEVWVLNLAGTPDWSLLAPAGEPPPGRVAFSAVYDPLRDRMIVFGGSNGVTQLNDTWALSLAGGGVWTRLNAQDSVPPVRASHRAVYDVARDRMVTLFGADILVWTFSPLAADLGDWSSQFLSNSPHGRSGPGMVLDAARDRVLVFGGGYRGRRDGYLGNYYLNDTWWLELGSPQWAPLQPAPPLPRAVYGSTAILDPVRDRVVLFGGADDASASADVWTLALPNGTAWEAANPSGAPPAPRNVHVAVYDPRRDRMVVFGGCTSCLGCSGVTVLSDTWVLDWQGCGAVAVPPESRGGLPLVSGARVRPVPAAGPATVDFVLGRDADAELQVFDLAGRRVHTSPATRMASGSRQLVWAPSPGTRSGIYRYVLTVRAGSERARASGVIVRTR